MQKPGPENGYLSEHVSLMLRSYAHLTGLELIEPCGDRGEDAKRLFDASIFVASHNDEADPILTYGNRSALELFGMPWDEFTQTPSRYTAETPERNERERLLETVAKDGFIDDYSGVRISKSGRRFQIRRATVWNLIDDAGLKVGQAATFSEWDFLDD